MDVKIIPAVTPMMIAVVVIIFGFNGYYSSVLLY